MPNYSNKTTGAIDANGEIVSHATRFLAPGVISIQVTGTFSGTMALEASLDGQTFDALQMVDVSNLHGNSPDTHTTITSPHLLCTNGFALAYVRVRATAWSSGTANITIVTLNG